MSTLEEKFLQAYDQYADSIFRHCHFRVFDREKARDILQETFTRTWQYISNGKKVDNFKTFLYRVANNLIIDGSRKHKESSLDELMENGFDVGTNDDQRLPAILDGKNAITTVQQLDPKYRDAVLMRYVDDLTPKEISAITGESENVISVRIYRGIQQLRERLNNNNG